MQNNHSTTFLRKRKALTLLPLLMLPFVTLAFWALGGGSEDGTANDKKNALGLNLELPDATHSEESLVDKLSFYNRAQEDSVKLRLQMQNDPYYKNRLDTMPIPVNMAPSSIPSHNAGGLNSSPLTSTGTNQETEAKINERLSAIQGAMQLNGADGKEESVNPPSHSKTTSPDVAKLENMMQVMNEKGGDDPEVEQLNGMLEKILDIQHPERVKERAKEKTAQKGTGERTANTSTQSIANSFFGKDLSVKKSANGFFGIPPSRQAGEEAGAIPAVVHGSQTITSGSTIKLRLTDGAVINGLSVPTGSFVYGIATLHDERLDIEVKSIRLNKNVLPVSLRAYDLDGIAGISVPGSISREVVKASADQSLASLDILGMDPSLTSQAANAGVQTVKGLLSRKVKAVKVTLKGGYAVLLKNMNDK